MFLHILQSTNNGGTPTRLHKFLNPVNCKVIDEAPDLFAYLILGFVISFFDFVLALELVQEMGDEFLLHIVFDENVVDPYASLPGILEFSIQALHCCVI